jgi:O-antigen/teichoic acid export membrane protein
VNIIKKLAKNSGVIIFGNIIDMIFNLAISISLARYFNQTGFGELSFLAIFFFFLGSVDNQWIRPILVREMSKDEENCAYIIGNGLIIKGLISILAIVLFWFTIWTLKAPAEIVTLAFFTSIGLSITSVISSYEIIFQIKLRMGNFVAFNLLSKILTLVLIYIVIACKGSLLFFYLLSLIPGIILLLQVRHYSAKIIKPKFEIDFGLWRKIFKESWPLGLTALFIFIYHRIDQIILFHFKGPDKVGLYSAAVRLAESFNIIPLALMTSVLPLMSKYYEASKDNFDMLYKLSFKYLLNFIIPIAVVISIFSEQITVFFFGKDFLSSSHALRILIWAEIFVFVGVVNNSILIATRKQIIDPIFTGASVAVNIALNFILIPKYSFAGAAIASVASYAVGPIMGYFIPSTKIYSRSMFYYSLKPLFISFLVACLIYYNHFSFLLSIFVTPLIYLPVMYFIKGIDRNDFYKLS